MIFFIDMFVLYVDGIDTFFYKNASVRTNNSLGKIRSRAAVHETVKFDLRYPTAGQGQGDQASYAGVDMKKKRNVDPLISQIELVLDLGQSYRTISLGTLFTTWKI